MTIAVVLVRAGIESGGSASAATTGGPRASATHAARDHDATQPAKRFYVVRAGDTLAAIAREAGRPVATGSCS